jgi:AMMECR1 domain-containing protein
MKKKKSLSSKISYLFFPLLFASLLFALQCTQIGCKIEIDEVAENSSEIVIEDEEIIGEETGVEITEEKDEPEIDNDEMSDQAFIDYVNTIEIDSNEFIELDYKDKEYLMDIAYKAVDDYFNGIIEPDESLFLKDYDDIDYKVFIGFRINGTKKGSYSAKKNNLARSVYLATQRTIEDTRFNGSITGDNLKDLKIEIIILGDEKTLDVPDYEKGIHGLRIEKEGKGATYYNTVAVEGNHGLDRLLEKLCEKAGFTENCAANGDVDIYYFPTIHFATTRYSDEIVTFYRCNTIDFLPDLDPGKIKDSLAMAEGWMLLNLDEEGNFNYDYNPANGEYSSSNNMIRQLMSSRWLAEKSSKEVVLDQMHRVNLDYVIRNWYREDGELGYIYFGEKSKIGAIGMGLRFLISSPYYEEYKDIAEKLANTIQFLQNEDGSLRAWYIEPDYSYDEEDLLYYYSGEAILSLVELYEKTGNEQYLNAAIKSQDYYLKEYVDEMEENYFPAYVPWHTISLYKLYGITYDEKYVDAIFKMNDEIIKMQNQDGKPYIDYLGRFYDPEHPEYGVAFSGSTAVDVEGLVYAYEAARQKNDLERMSEYKKAIFLGAHNLMNMQFKDSNMYYLSHPERVVGSIRYDVDDHRIRIDTTQHTIDAFQKIIEVFEID